MTKKTDSNETVYRSIESAVQGECERQAQTNWINPVYWTEHVLLAIGDVQTIAYNRKMDTKIQALLKERHQYDCDILDTFLDTVDSVSDTADQSLDLVYACL